MINLKRDIPINATKKRERKKKVGKGEVGGSMEYCDETHCKVTRCLNIKQDPHFYLNIHIK